MIERRKSFRYTVLLPIRVSALDTVGQAAHEGTVFDVSSAGVCFTLAKEQSLQVGARVQLNISLPEPNSTIEGIGRIVREGPSANGNAVSLAATFEQCELKRGQSVR
jgi:hypothetical protein